MDWSLHYKSTQLYPEFYQISNLFWNFSLIFNFSNGLDPSKKAQKYLLQNIDEALDCIVCFESAQLTVEWKIPQVAELFAD